MQNLLDTQVGKVVRFVRFNGGESFQMKLLSLGLLPGDTARVLRRAPLDGPVLVEVDGREFALGRGVAARIEVEESLPSCA